MAFFAMPQSTAIKIVKPTVSEVDSPGKQRLRKGTGIVFFADRMNSDIFLEILYNASVRIFLSMGK